MVSYQSLPTELQVECNGPVREITLNRPENRNAINAGMHQGLMDVWTILADDLDARAVIIRSNGPTFTAGGDFSWFLEQQQDRSAMEIAVRDGQRVLERMIACNLPIVAAIQGGAVGLGASLGILSDLVVMSDDAFYRDPHVSLGLVAGDGGVAWPQTAPMQIAKQYLLLGDRLPAAEAYRLGMVNAVVPRADLDDTARHFAQRLGRLPRRAAQATKRSLNLQLERQIHGIAEYALVSEMLCMVDPEFKERVVEMTKGKGAG